MPSIADLAAVDETVADGDLLALHNISKGTNLKDQGLTITKLRSDAFLARANTWSGKQTFSGGINLGNTDLSIYRQDTWEPAITTSGTAPSNLVISSSGTYTRIGNVVMYVIGVTITSFTSLGTGDLRISLPFTAVNNIFMRGTLMTQGVDLPGTSAGLVFVPTASTAYGRLLVINDDAAATVLQVTALAAGDQISATGFYFV